MLGIEGASKRRFIRSRPPVVGGDFGYALIEDGRHALVHYLKSRFIGYVDVASGAWAIA